MKRIITLILLIITVNAYGESGFGYTIGGFKFKDSTLLLNKFSLEEENFSVILDLTYDNYNETWSDGSHSDFTINGVSIGGRYYPFGSKKGFFGGLSLGMIKSTLTTSELGTEKRVSDQMFVSGYELGYRASMTDKPIFLELGLRTTEFSKDLHLYTTNSKPDINTIDNISYQSWVFKKSESASQIYIGGGITF